MSTKINVTIGNARLLQASQRRVAANQQALNTRTEQKQDAAKAEEVVDREVVQPESERRNGILDTVTPRRPAAQRQPQQDEYDLAFLDKYSVEIILNSLTTISPGPWSYTVGRVRIDGIISCPPDPINTFPYNLDNVIVDRATASTKGILDNFYSEFATKFAPTLNYRSSLYALPTRVQTQTNDVVPTWLTQITYFITEFTTICGSPFKEFQFSGNVVSNGPTFPRNNLYARPSVLLALVSSTPQYVHFTALIREERYDVIQAVGSSPYINRSPGFKQSFDSGSVRRIAASGVTRRTYGYYIRFDVATRTVESRLVTLEDRFEETQLDRGRGLFASSFVSLDIRQKLVAGMYQTDPRKALAEPVLALDPDVSVFGYNPAAGTVYFHGKILGVENLGTYLYSATIPRNTPYTSVFFLLKSAKAQLSILPEAPGTFTVEENTSSSAPYPRSVFTLRQTLIAPVPGTQAPIIGVVPRLRR